MTDLLSGVVSCHSFCNKTVLGCLFLDKQKNPLRVLLYAQGYWKFNRLECTMCMAPAMFVSLNVYLPPEPPFICGI